MSSTMDATNPQERPRKHGRTDSAEDEFHGEHHVYEPHKAGLPPMGPYSTSSGAGASSPSSSPARACGRSTSTRRSGQLWLVLNPLLLAASTSSWSTSCAAAARGSVFFAHLMAGLFASNFVEHVDHAGAAVGRRRAAGSSSTRPSRGLLLPLSAVLDGVPAVPADAGRLRGRAPDRRPADRAAAALGDPDHSRSSRSSPPAWRCSSPPRRSTSATSRASCRTSRGSGSTLSPVLFYARGRAPAHAAPGSSTSTRCTRCWAPGATSSTEGRIPPWRTPGCWAWVGGRRARHGGSLFFISREREFAVRL